MSGVFLHPEAVVETESLGEGTRIGAFAHIRAGAVIGRDCQIGDHVVIEHEVKMGDRVRIGANSTIKAGTSIAADAVVDAGAVVTSDVPNHAVVAGDPARLVRFEGADEMSSDTESRVAGARLSQVGPIEDQRGKLVVREFDSSLPFKPERLFMSYSVPEHELRGQHAHKTLEQFIIALHGSVRVLLDDGAHRETARLDSPELGLYVPPLTWCTLYHPSPGAVIGVLASAPYDPDDYLHDYEEFVERSRKR